jgi:hypothetical protein
MSEHWFWWLLSISCVVWYTTITIYVAVKGYSDIRNMLRRLENEQRKSTSVG